MSRYTGEQQFSKRVRIRAPRQRRNRFRIRAPRIRQRHFHPLRFPGMNRGSLNGTAMYHQAAIPRGRVGGLYHQRGSGLSTFRSQTRLGR